MSMKKWIALFMAAFLCISMVGCAGTADGQNKNDAGTETGGGQDAENMTTDVVPDQQDARQSDKASGENRAYDGAGQPEEYENDTWYVKDGQITGLNEQIEKDGCVWTVSSFEVTKERGSRQESDFNYWGEEMDADGTLTGAESYLFVTVSCKNSGDQTQEVLLNSNGFVTIDETGQLSESGGEARYISKKQDGNEDPVKAFHYLLEPGEETGMVEIGYIVEDSILNDSVDLYYCIGQRGSEMGNPENRYIEVKK